MAKSVEIVEREPQLARSCERYSPSVVTIFCLTFATKWTNNSGSPKRASMYAQIKRRQSARA